MPPVFPVAPGCLVEAPFVTRDEHAALVAVAEYVPKRSSPKVSVAVLVGRQRRLQHVPARVAPRGLQDVLRGQRLVVDLTNGVSRMEAGQGGTGRVEGMFRAGGGSPIIPDTGLNQPKR